MPAPPPVYGVCEVSYTAGAGHQIIVSGAVAAAYRFADRVANNTYGHLIRVSDTAGIEFLRARFTAPNILTWTEVVTSSAPGDAKISWPATGQRTVELLSDFEALLQDVLPRGGACRYALFKASGEDFDVEWQGVPVVFEFFAEGIPGSAAAAGTVTSVALTAPAEISVAGSPVTTNGTLAVTWAPQAANIFLAGPTDGGAATPAYRALVASDLPNTAVTAGSYTNTDLTIDPQGRVTAASNGGAAGGTIVPPQGRLTLTSGAPVMTADVTAATTIYYAAYVGGFVPVGATLAMLAIPGGQVSMGLAAANFVSGSVYDIFAIDNAGTLVVAIGPAWTSTTARGTGAGTTELTLSNGGIWTNANSLTNAYGGAAGATNYGSVAANAATYLGSAYATANGQTGIQFRPAAANGGSNTIVGLYNAYNRLPITSFSFDNTNNYTYNSATWRVANAGGTGSGLNNRITWLDGLGQSRVVGSFNQSISANASVATKGQCGIVFDATSGTPPGSIGEGGMVSTSDSVQATGTDQMTALGLHYAQAMEAAFTATTKYFGSITYLTVRLDMMN